VIEVHNYSSPIIKPGSETGLLFPLTLADVHSSLMVKFTEMGETYKILEMEWVRGNDRSGE